ncbi:hypothetical protein QBC46DRAFT_462308 [Diplogelasinospora grovesii]|uniref:Uncharacterized protein n=1 Tax=Diplogelasinospora grovesii TaxID=303347 RepID=A0AAN6RYY7_9PEZI|nr:hypothetical protein QBC46DRAFT_462308 [Diplogelasinospora grovesii]
MADYAARRRLAQHKRPERVHWLEAAKVPFRDDSLMLGPPSLTAADFKTPRLRRCRFDLATVSWEARIDGGLDGYVWKVKFGDEGPFVLKVFWDPEPPRSHHYYAPRRECQNAALLQMMEAAVKDATSRREQRFAQRADRRPILSIPRMKKCYGWLTVHGNLFHGMSRKLRPQVVTAGKVTRSMSYDQEYLAVVDEFVEEGENDPEVVQEVLDFLRLGGFAHTLSPAARNWKSGVLIDRGNIIHPGDYCWNKQLYVAITARRVLKQ